MPLFSVVFEPADDFHVVIKADDEYRVRRDLEAEVSSLPSFHPVPWRSGPGALC